MNEQKQNFTGSKNLYFKNTQKSTEIVMVAAMASTK